MTNTVFTIGHSTHSTEKFIELLKAAHIDAVSDVRSRPYSRMNPQFNREPLKKVLNDHNIKYVFLGKELGARSEDPSCYRNRQVQYDLLADTDLFKQGINRVKEGAGKYHLALMCAEKEPLDCHRTILVARELVKEGLDIKHVLSDGRIEDHDHALERLIEKLGVLGTDMFRSKQIAVDEAYALQSKEIAYRENTQEASGQTQTFEQYTARVAK